MSTHSQDIHIKAREAILECDYRIIADADFDFKTFCMDGIIIACHKDNLTITDTNKIYMPINDKFIIPLISLAFHEVRINNALPYYIVYLNLDSPYRTFSVMSDVNQLFFNNNVLNVRHGLCGLKYFEEKKDKYFENINACEYSYQMYYYSNVIKRCLRKRVENHKKFNFLIKLNRKYRIIGNYAYGIFPPIVFIHIQIYLSIIFSNVYLLLAVNNLLVILYIPNFLEYLLRVD